MKGVLEDTNNMVKKLYAIANELEPLLPAEDISNFREFIDHNEVGVGLEILLTQIYEYDTMIPKRIYQILENIGRGHIDDDYFNGIKTSDS